MKKFIFLFLCFVLFSFGEEETVVAGAWFDQVTKPLACSQEDMCRYAGVLRQMLKEGKTPSAIAEAAPEDNRARVVFITLGGKNWPGRSYFGTGFTFRMAVENAVKILQANEPVLAAQNRKQAKSKAAELAKEKKPLTEAWKERLERPEHWEWLRMEIVQYAKSVSGFSVPRSRIAMTSLVGIAFSSELGFAFTPEQITGRCLLDRTRHLSKGQIVNFITESYNWPALGGWMKVGDISGGYRVSLFETDSYYADDKQAVRLYRGHRLENEPVAAELALLRAAICARSVTGQLSSGKGRVKTPFTAWIQDNSPSSRAEFAIALYRLGRLQDGRKQQCGIENAAWCDAQAKIVLRFLEKKMVSAGRGKCVEEQEHISGKSILLPRPVAYLRTNALCCLALLESGEDAARRSAQEIALHIRSQYDGKRFAEGMLMLDHSPLRQNEAVLYASVGDSALAALALVRAGRGEGGNPAMEKAGIDILKKIFTEFVMVEPLERLQADPWLLEAMLALPMKDGKSVSILLRLGLAAIADLDYSPLYPDYFCAIRKNPSCTLAANRSRLLCTLSKWLAENGKKAWAKEELSQAIPVVMFQMQAFMDEAGASLLPTPGEYEGWFRDNLEDYGFNLEGQTAQILSLVAYVDCLKIQPMSNIAQMLRQRRNSQVATDIHPSALQTELVATDSVNSSIDNHASSGTLDKPTTRQLKKSDLKPKKKNGVQTEVHLKR